MKHYPHAALSCLALLLGLFSLVAPAPAAKLDPDSEDFFHMARHFMTRDEEKAFRNLITPELREEFIEAFWEIRDPDPLTKENEFRTELEERFIFVNKYLRESNHPGWDTARGMVYMVLGPPSIMNAGSTPALSASPPGTVSGDGMLTNTIVWPYEELDFLVFFVDRQGFGVYELDTRNTSPRLLELLKAGKTRIICNEKGTENRFLKFDAKIKSASDRLFITIPLKDLHFDIDAKGGYTARIHLAVNLYFPDGTIITCKDDRRIALDLEMQKKRRLAIEWMIPLKRGKSQVDLLVLDQIGGLSNRQLLAVKKK